MTAGPEFNRGRYSPEVEDRNQALSELDRRTATVLGGGVGIASLGSLVIAVLGNPDLARDVFIVAAAGGGAGLALETTGTMLVRWVNRLRDHGTSRVHDCNLHSQ